MDYSKDDYEKTFKTIINCAYDVHKELGPGLLESVYEECFLEELKIQGLEAKIRLNYPSIIKVKNWTKLFILMFWLKIK